LRLRAQILNTFRGRLAVLYISIELSILIVAAMVLYLVLSHKVSSAVDEELLSQGQSLVGELERSPFYFWSRYLDSFSAHFSGSVELVEAHGMILFNSDDTLTSRGGDEISEVMARAMRRDGPAFISTRSLLRKDNLRIIALPVHRMQEQVAILLLARNTNDIQGFFKLLYLIGGMLGLISMAISAWAGFVMAKRALAPIQEITVAARAVAAGDLSRRLNAEVPDKEIRVLVRALNKMFGDLQASFQSQKRFTADASHELRLPLTIMKGEIEVALRQPRPADEYADTLRHQLDTIERMQRIVNDLLTLAKADAGTLELAQEPIDLSLMLQEAGQHHLVLFAQKNIGLDMDLEDGLEVMGDASHLERAILNLLNNAWKYAPEGSTVYMSAHAHDNHVRIGVRDEGPGIGVEHQSLVFDRFYRADDARARSGGEGAGGAGLGLAICKRIVEAHGGRIWVESQPGHGAQFLIDLPLSGPDPNYSRRLHALMSPDASA
jgi:heavy metal sensor kinase